MTEGQAIQGSVLYIRMSRTHHITGVHQAKRGESQQITAISILHFALSASHITDLLKAEIVDGRLSSRIFNDLRQLMKKIT